ncbi:MAG: HAD-superfamily hydrolase, subfamily [Herbinix sp.]|nr:HAD-superfamily hydrolase, subfamily [Herbinix sp.]
MNSNILFFDIDGTILSHRTSKISDSTKAAIKQAQSNGHLVFINTGRTLAELDENITNIGFDGYVCGCGTYITYHDEILHQTTLSPELVKELIEDLRVLNIEGILEGKQAVYYDNHIKNQVVRKIKEEQALKHNVKSWNDKDISFDKFCIWSESDENYKLFYDKYKEALDFIRRSKHFTEVVPKNYSKATGIEFLLNHLNIPHENTFALGDSTNDLTMLQYVKYSIGMGNSCKEILEMVSYITDDVDNDGIANALKHFYII